MVKYPVAFWKRFIPEARENIVLADSVIDSWIEAGSRIKPPAEAIYLPTCLLGEQELSDLVDFNWLARRIVRGLVEAAYQDIPQFVNPEDAATWERINALDGNDDGAFVSAAVLARTHGVSLLVIGQSWTGDPEEPVRDFGAPIDWLEPVRSEDFSVSSADTNQDKSDPQNFGKPDYYCIHGQNRLNGLRIHRSRVVHFSGPAYSDPMHSRQRLKMQGLSALDPVQAVLQMYGMSWQDTASLIKQASTPVWKMGNVVNAIARNSKQVQDRMSLQQELMRINKAVILDASLDEEFKREAVNFADLPQLLQQLSLAVASAAETPVSELFGRIVSGLGDTGDVEDQKWTRRVKLFRTKTLDPRVRRLMGPGAVFDWKPLREQTPEERSRGVRGFWDMGQVLDSEVRKIAEDALNLNPLTPAQLTALQAQNARGTYSETPTPTY